MHSLGGHPMPTLFVSREAAVKDRRLWVVFILLGAWVGIVAGQQPGDRSALRSLPRITDLPSSYHPIGKLADRGEFFATGTPLHRIDDGDAHHGLPATAAWATKPKDKKAQTQGAIYGVENGRITSAGYVIRQADLVAGKSFHGLTLRELEFPSAHYLTIDLIKGATEGSNQYLWLWHFLPQPDRVRPMLRAGELQSVTSLPRTFAVLRNDAYANDFYPRMGRHHRDFSTPANRLPGATGDDSLWYGEAAGKLIFIEYIFSQQEFAAGASWSYVPLNSVPIPPIDNVHILHYNPARSEAPGTFTTHMYFIPEETYLAWEKEPPGL